MQDARKLNNAKYVSNKPIAMMKSANGVQSDLGKLKKGIIE